MNDTTHQPETVDPDLAVMIADVVSAHAPATSGTGPDEVWDADLWATLQQIGLTDLTVPESDGGSGAGWPEIALLLSTMASETVAQPVGEHDLLARWLLRSLDLNPADPRRRTVAICDRAGVARAVPWARVSERIVCLVPSADGWQARDLDRADVEIEEGSNLAGESRDRVLVPAGTGAPVPAEVVDELHLRGALLRAIQVVGALEGSVEASRQHVRERTQFGRLLGAFQAIQHLVAEMAAETALARAAVDAAVLDVTANGTPDRFLVAVARSCAGHAAGVVVRHAHQVHGAIGTTTEHRLHRLTLPALAWRREFGATEDWDRVVAAEAGAAPDLWSLLTR